MPRTKNPKFDEALRLYQNGMKIKEISQELEVPSGTLRRWKQSWDSELNEQREREKELTLQEKYNLTDEQFFFCINFTRMFNATKAYQKAYGVGYNTAAANGSRLLKKANVQSCVRELKINLLNKKMLKPEDIFQKYMDIAFGDIKEFVSFGVEEQPVIGMYGPVKVKDKNGEERVLTQKVNVMRLNDSEEVDGSLIQEIKQEKGGISIKMPDREKALRWLADHLNMATAEQKAKIEKIKADTARIKGEDIEEADGTNFVEALGERKDDIWREN